MTHVFFCVFLLVFSYTTSSSAMDPAKNSAPRSYHKFESDEPAFFRCDAEGRFEQLKAGHYVPMSYQPRYDESRGLYYYNTFEKTYFLKYIPPFQERQVIGEGGSYRTDLKPVSLSPDPTERQKSKKIQISAQEDDLGLELLVDRAEQGMGELIFPRALSVEQTDLMISMCKDSEWVLFDFFIDKSENLINIVNLAKENKLKVFNLEADGINQEAMKYFVDFVVENTSLEKVSIKMINCEHADLLIGKMVNKSGVKNIEINMPFENYHIYNIMGYFSDNNRLGPGCKIEISNHIITTKDTWYSELISEYKKKLDTKLSKDANAISILKLSKQEAKSTKKWF